MKTFTHALQAHTDSFRVVNTVYHLLISSLLYLYFIINIDSSC